MNYHHSRIPIPTGYRKPYGRTPLFNIVEDMIEQIGAEKFLEHTLHGMSTDELYDIVKHIDQHVFENHYL